MSGIPVAILIGGMLLLMLTGLPLAFSIFAVSTLVMMAYTKLPLWQIMQRFFAGVDSFVLTAIPFFLLAGNLMNSGKITDKLIQLSSTMVGHIRGGLAHINVLVSLLFGGVSGSAVADTSGVGTILIPAMARKGYSTSFTVAVTVTSSVLGQIIPPSLIMIVYAATAGTSVQAMFVAGIIPGVLLAGAMMLVSHVYAIKYDYPREKRHTFLDFLRALRKSFLVLLMPVIIIGGVLSGVCTATESAVIAVVYTLIITIFIEKTLTFGELPPIFIQTAKSTAVTLFCIGAATAFGYLLAYFRTNEYIFQVMREMELTQTSYIIFLVVLFTILGMFMDATPAICIFVPFIIPAGIELGMHPVHVGMIICLVIAFGLVTPPYGLCLLLGCQIAGIAPQKVFRDLLFMMLAVAVTLLIIIFIPDLILWLPRLVVPKYM
ncbi:MAG: TRAP transporter large permease [Planctomycetota bacterium]|jgi:tripartite ATP-independent transporter DctM subunit|nr:TRAP transporter large permease [Planctomycetota bacterium]